MKKFLNRVTITGADSTTPIPALTEITKEFPFVEWGILLSKTSAGCPRFPSLQWLEDLFVEKMAFDLRLSGHLCGRWVRDICKGELTVPSWIYGSMNRLQLNFHAYAHDALPGFAQILQDMKKPIILQFDDVNNILLTSLRQQTPSIDVFPLFDTSGGTGVLPGEWPKWIAPYSGYAGGLSPENLTEQLERIEKVAETPSWIDVETMVRTPDDLQLDLAKVRKFLETARPWVMEN